MNKNLLGFFLAMWGLILIGGGIIVKYLGPISISGYGEFDLLFSSLIKMIIAIFLVVFWIIILLKLKNWIFRKEIKF